MRRFRAAALAVLWAASTSGSAQGPSPSAPPASPGASSVARVWTDALLFAIRSDFARPPVHARNLYHLAVAMYDAWAVHDPVARPLFFGTDLHPACAVATGELERLTSMALG